MRTPVLVTLVVLLHVAAVSSFLFVQGCGTTRGPATAGSPPAPVMPPGQPPPDGAIISKPVFQPPAPVKPEPAMTEPAAGSTYAVQKGDSLSAIAKRYGVSSRELADVNNIKDANRIRIGQKLILPAHASAEPRPASAAASGSSASAKATGPAYVVQAGDSLSKIAVKQGTSVQALREANKLTSDKILVGQKLSLPEEAKAATPSKKKEKVASASASAAKSAAPADAPAAAESAPPASSADGAPAAASADDGLLPYTVQEGDTMDEIAKLFIVDKQALMKVNNITDESSIRPNQKIKIPPPDF